MQMTKLGATVRQIRQNKGLTLAAVADSQITESFLSKFERGVTDISVTKFLHLLDRILTTPEEFFYLHGNVPLPQPARGDGYQTRAVLMHRLLPSGASEQMAAERYRTAPTLLNALTWRVQQMQQAPLAQIGQGRFSAEAVHYLYGVDDWGEFELYLFTFFALDMHLADERRLFKVALNRSQKYSTFRGAPLLRFDITHNQLFIEMRKQAYPVAKSDLTIYAALLEDRPNAQHEIYYRFIQAWWLYRTNQQTAAANAAATTVQLAAALRLHHLAQFAQDTLTAVATHGPEYDQSFFELLIE